MNIKLLGGTGFAATLLCMILTPHGNSLQASSLGRETAAPMTSMEKVKTLTLFAPPVITGFLKPKGFTRPSWQALEDRSLELTDPEPAERFVVMLDPGHGGVDPGSKAHNGLLEKDLTLDIARRVRLFLSEFNDIEVIFTRDHDNGLSRQARVNAIRYSNADMVISLHFNHLPQSDVTLVESYYAGPENIAASQASRQKNLAASGRTLQRTHGTSPSDLSFTKGSARLARTIQHRVFNEVSFENPQADNGGVKKDTLFVLTRSFTPGALIELTCLSNQQEAEKLNTEEYRNRLAAALADGIRNFRESSIKTPWSTQTMVGT